ncbi:hypothetical protein ACWDZ8_22070 [Streptomyces sp. NPDC003233]
MDLADIENIARAAANLFATAMVRSAGGELASSGVRRLVELVRAKLSDSEGRAVLTLIDAEPSNDTRVRMLGDILTMRARSDAEFAEALARLLGERTSGTATVNAVESGITAGGDVTVRGRNFGGRDVRRR